MVLLRQICAFAAFLFFFFQGNSQVHICTLDIGGKNAENVSEIFQLNDDQNAQMEVLRTEYALAYEAFEEESKKLLDEHPQSTAEELTTLAGKYRTLQENITEKSRTIDEKLLKTFNQRQYDLYLSLCHEAFRRPIEVTPVIYDGPATEKK